MEAGQCSIFVGLDKTGRVQDSEAYGAVMYNDGS
jgi:hypothetical protein